MLLVLAKQAKAPTTHDFTYVRYGTGRTYIAPLVLTMCFVANEGVSSTLTQRDTGKRPDRPNRTKQY